MKNSLYVFSMLAIVPLTGCIATGTPKVVNESKSDKSAGQTVQAPASGQEIAPVLVSADTSIISIKNGDQYGKVYTVPARELSKKFKIATGLKFGTPAILAFDASNSAGRRVILLSQKGASRWVVTGDLAVKAPTNGLVFMGTVDKQEADEDDSGEGAPKTTCFIDSKVVRAFGFLKLSKNSYDQPFGGLAWTVDKEGKPSPVTKLNCKF